MLLLIWGSFAAVSKLVLGETDSYQTLFYIFCFSAVIRIVQAIAKGTLRQFRQLGKKDWFLLVFCGLLFFLYYFLYLMAMDMIPAVEAMIINYLFPVFIVLFAVPINKEKLTALKIVSLVVCFAGIVVLVTGGNFADVRLSSLPGDLLALGAAVSWGLFSNFGKRNQADPDVSYFVYTIVSLAMSVAAMSALSVFQLPDLPVMAGCAWLGLGNIVLALAMWIRIMKQSSASTAATLSFFAPFVSLALIALLTDEKITVAALIGMALIVAGNVIQNLRARK